MSPNIPYSAKRDDLYFPGRAADFFASGVLKSEAALCGELARLAYCRQEPGFVFDLDRIHEFLRRAGFGNCWFFESQGKPGGEGTHCFLAVRKDAAQRESLAVVSFRGTDKDDPTDLGTDADVILAPWEKGGQVHQGFKNALGEVRHGVEKALQGIACRVVFAGHSLGAALATLLASARKPDALYLFGSPRVGDEDFVATVEGVESCRYVDCRDLVTRVPPKILGYAHLGEPYYIDRNRQVTFNPSPAFMEQDG